MQTTLRIDDHGLSAKLTAAASKMRDKKPMLVEIGEYQLKSTRLNFDQERDPEGHPWKRLKRPRDPRGGRHGGGLRTRATRILAVSMLSRSIGIPLTSYKILQDTGRLLRSILAKVTATTVAIGTNVIYAATHQFGRDHIPARPYLGLREEDMPAILDIAARWQRRQLTSSGVEVR